MNREIEQPTFDFEQYEQQGETGDMKELALSLHEPITRESVQRAMDVRDGKISPEKVEGELAIFKYKDDDNKLVFGYWGYLPGSTELAIMRFEDEKEQDLARLFTDPDFTGAFSSGGLPIYKEVDDPTDRGVSRV
jgi:hypothetical protein